MMEAIEPYEQITGQAMTINTVDENGIGDHVCWISDIQRFRSHYPEWTPTRDVPDILRDIHDALVQPSDSAGAKRAGLSGKT